MGKNGNTCWEQAPLLRDQLVPGQGQLHQTVVKVEAELRPHLMALRRCLWIVQAAAWMAWV